MQRICFQLQVRPDRIDEYVALHQSVWPTMLRAIEASGRRNYSLFLRPDGLLIGYYETDDNAASDEALVNNPDTEAWEAQAASYFTDLRGVRPDQHPPVLQEIFNLEEQLKRLTPRSDALPHQDDSPTPDHLSRSADDHP